MALKMKQPVMHFSHPGLAFHNACYSTQHASKILIYSVEYSLIGDVLRVPLVSAIPQVVYSDWVLQYDSYRAVPITLPVCLVRCKDWRMRLLCFFSSTKKREGEMGGGWEGVHIDSD